MKFKCAWCLKSIKPNQSIYTIGAKVLKGVDLSKDEGKIKEIYFISRKRIIPAIIPTSDSEAKKAGNDILFTVCSVQCGNNMKESLNIEINLRETNQSQKP